MLGWADLLRPPATAGCVKVMRSTLFARALLIGAVLFGHFMNVSADDDLFMPSYHRMGLVPAPGVAGAARTSERPPFPDSPSTASRPRITWPKRGRKEKAPVDPVTPPPSTPVPGLTVASALSVRAESETSSPLSPRGLLTRLRKDEPQVPPGLPRGMSPREMVPPEPIEARPELARLSATPLDRLEDPVQPATSSSFVARSVDREPSPFAPVRVSDRLIRTTESQLGSRAAIPPLIARPSGPAADSPLRRVRASGTDLESSPTSIDGGGLNLRP